MCEWEWRLPQVRFHLVDGGFTSSLTFQRRHPKDMISGDHKLAANASSVVNDDIIALKMELVMPQPFVEIFDFPEDAAAYLATSNVHY